MRTSVMAGTVAFVMALGLTHADACGDKFVRVGRGGRFQRGYVAVHPAAILVYVNPASPDIASMQKLPSLLKAAGHKASAVESTSAFAEALKAGRYDLVLAQQTDIPALQTGLGAAPTRPEVLPVLHNPTKAELLAAEEAHTCVVGDVTNGRDVLVNIDQMLDRRK